MGTSLLMDRVLPATRRGSRTPRPERLPRATHRDHVRVVRSELEADPLRVLFLLRAHELAIAAAAGDRDAGRFEGVVRRRKIVRWLLVGREHEHPGLHRELDDRA